MSKDPEGRDAAAEQAQPRFASLGSQQLHRQVTDAVHAMCYTSMQTCTGKRKDGKRKESKQPRRAHMQRASLRPAVPAAAGPPSPDLIRPQAVSLQDRQERAKEGRKGKGASQTDRAANSTV